MKKLLLVVAIGALGLGSYVGYTKYQEHVYKEEVAVSTTRLKQKFKDAEYKKMDGLKKTYILNNTTYVLKDVEESNTFNYQTIEVRNFHNYEYSPKITQYQIIKNVYTLNKESRNFDKKTSVNTTDLVVKATNEPYDRKSIFKNEEAYNNVKRLIFEQIITKNPKISIHDLEVGKYEDQLGYNNVKIYYNKEKLRIDTHLEKVGIIELNYEDVYPYINTEYIDIVSEKIPNTNKKVALTFDDGPAEYTNKLLDILKEEGVKATFFALGSSIENFPEEARRIVADGHELESHTYSHADLQTLTPKDAQADFIRSEEAMFEATGKLPKYVRPPYGSINKDVSNSLNIPSIMWSVDSEDWAIKNDRKIVKKVMQNVYDGSIILLHDIHPFSVDAVKPIITKLKEDGYTFSTIEEMFPYGDNKMEYFGINDFREIE